MSYLPYEPQQQSLLPQALQDGLPEGHLAYFIGDAIDSLDLRTFYARYEDGGSRNQPFHPRQHLTNRSLGVHAAEDAQPAHAGSSVMLEPPSGGGSEEGRPGPQGWSLCGFCRADS